MSDRQTTIRDTTTLALQLKVVLPIIATIVMASIGFYGGYLGLKQEISDASRFSWSLHDQREWASEMSQHNTNSWIPNPNDIFWKNHKAVTVGRYNVPTIASGN